MTPEERAESAVEEIVATLRQRNVLKWLFDEDPDTAGELWPGVNAITADVQEEMFREWEAIIVRHMTRTT